MPHWGAGKRGILTVAKKKSVPNRQQAHVKHENKFITMPKEKFIKICVIVGVVILAVVLFFVLRRAYDGHLPVEDGAVVTQGDNWLVVNTESPNARYFRLGEVGEVEGYTLESAPYSSDANVLTYTYTPEGEAEGEGQPSVAVIPVVISYDQYAQNVQNNLMLYAGIVSSEMEELEVNGTAARGFSFAYIPTEEETAEDEASADEEIAEEEASAGEETAEDEAAEEVEMPAQRIYDLVLQAGHGSCVLVEASSYADTEEELLSAEALKEEALKIAGAMIVD